MKNFATFLAALCMLSISLSIFSFKEKSTSVTHYGALIQPPNLYNAFDFKLAVAGKLGITCIRDAVMINDNAKVPFLNTNYDVVLNINSVNPGITGAKPFMRDTVTYKQQLQKRVAALCFNRKPVLIVIENEESNLKYHSGPAQDYINQLAAATGIVHAFGIAITNAGITPVGLHYCIYQNYLSQGKKDSAKIFSQACKLSFNNPKTQDRGAFVEALLTAYKKLNIDFVNIHYYQSGADTYVLKTMIEYIQQRTGKPAISNETGQFDNYNATVTAMLQEYANHQCRYVLWYSATGDGARAKPLHKPDASLYSTGETFHQFITQ